MTSMRYQEQVLSSTLLPFYQTVATIRHNVQFQQDGAPSHWAKSTQQWFTRHNIPLLFHPANSPNLNPIEAIWAQLKHRLRMMKWHPTTEQKLCEACLAIWEEIPIENINRQVQKMSEKVRAVKEKRGVTQNTNLIFRFYYDLSTTYINCPIYNIHF